MKGKSATAQAERRDVERAIAAPPIVSRHPWDRSEHEPSESTPAWIWCLVGLGAIFVSVLGGYILGASISGDRQGPIAASPAEAKTDAPRSAEAGKVPAEAARADGPPVLSEPYLMAVAGEPAAGRTFKALETPDAATQPGPPPASKPAGPVHRKVQRPVPPVLPEGPIVEVEAFAGEPFGVGKITVVLPEGSRPIWCSDQCLGLEAENDRAFYPAFDVQYADGEGQRPWQVARYESYFLFKGNEPFQVTLTADTSYVASVRPQVDAAQRRDALLRSWWWSYNRTKRLFSEDYGQPQIVKEYLRDMLRRRLELPSGSGGGSAGIGIFAAIARAVLWPFTPSPGSQSNVSTSGTDLRQWLGWGSLDRDFDRFLGLLFGTESLSRAFGQEKTLDAPDQRQPADQPLPQAIVPAPLPRFGYPPNVEIEPIAGHVPQECFYVRCGSLASYLWLRDTTIHWGGSFDDLISMQAMDPQVRPRIERQLALSTGDAVRGELDGLISDMALIGTDVFFRDGVAIGVLLKARDGEALAKLIRRERDNTRRQCPGAVETEVLLGGHHVSLLAAPDNVVRSFYAVDGDYHLVTTSSYIAGRFFEAGKGRGSLGTLAEFRHARDKLPLARGDTVFIYLSDPFFRMLVGPQYRIEMTRRVRALRDLKLVYLARLAARAEGLPHDGVPSLVGARLLPEGFLTRPDGSGPVLEGENLRDSLRGAAGTFLPVPDVELTAATRAETQAYTRFANEYQTQWRRLDPVVIGIRRESRLPSQFDRVVLDVHITPYAREHYEALFTQLHPPDRVRLREVPGDVMTLEARLRNPRSWWIPVAGQNARTYAGLRDVTTPYTISNGKVETLPLRATALAGTDYCCYVGTAGPERQPPHLQNAGEGEAGDVAGYSHSERMLSIFNWRRAYNGGWETWAHRKDILEEVTPQLALESAPRPAQVRFRLGDLSSSKLGPAIRALCFMHARRISATNVDLMHQLVEQLHVSPDQARKEAERLFGARLVCPLGGDYRLTGEAGGPRRWVGTAWPQQSVYLENALPDNYHFAFLQWLRGAEMELSLDPITLSAHVELTVKRSAVPGPKEIAPWQAPGVPPTDVERLQGDWIVLEGWYDGRVVDGYKGVRISVKGDQVTQPRPNGAALKWQFRLHPAQEPKGIDCLAEGESRWQECSIYRLEDARLTFCHGEGYGPRPADFQSKAGDRKRLVVLKRPDAEKTLMEQ